MSRFDDQPIFRNGTTVSAIDEGLRTFMLRVYNYMALGLGISGLISYLVASSPALYNTIFGSPLRILFMLAPLGVVMFLSSRIHKMDTSKAQMYYWIFAALMGISHAHIFHEFKGGSLASMFFVSASIFGTMSLYGYTTKKDLTSMGSFMMMGVYGVIVALIVNMFIQNNVMFLLLNVLIVVIFTGLTAYQTQELKEIYSASDSEDVIGKKAIFGALNLYMAFINIFMALLHIFGDRK